MSTKTFLFLGYSLKDPSFDKIRSGILEKIGKFARTSYAVLGEPTEADISRWEGKGVIVINAYAYPFMMELRNKLVDQELLFDVERDLFLVENELSEINSVDVSIHQESDLEFLTAMYIDGMQHALEGIIYDLEHGTTKELMRKELHEQSVALQKWKRRRGMGRDIEVAYYTGRKLAVEWFLTRHVAHLPKYFSDTNMQPITKQDFESERRRL
jgi:hypothetical protein